MLWVPALVAVASAMLWLGLGRSRTISSPPPGTTNVWSGGRLWEMTSNYPGIVSVVDPKGQLRRTESPSPGAAAGGVVTIRMVDQETSYSKPGAYRVESPQGTDLGTVVLHRPGASPGERYRDVCRAAPEQPVAGLMGQGADWECGFDEGFGLVLTVSGGTSVHVSFADSLGGRQEGGYRVQSQAVSLPPTVEWEVEGLRTRAEGYGTYAVVAKDGRRLTTLEVSPFPGPQSG